MAKRTVVWRAAGTPVRPPLERPSEKHGLMAPGSRPALAIAGGRVMNPKEGKKRLSRASLAQGFIPGADRHRAPPLQIPERFPAHARPPPASA